MKNIIERKLKYWYVPLILGILFIGLGILVFATPAQTFVTLAILFSIGFIFAGLLEIFYSLSSRKSLKNWGWNLAGGILTFFIGLHLVIRPELSALLLSLYIGFWVLFRSVMYISTAFELKDLKEKNWGWILFFGILGLFFSFLLMWNPIITGITVAFWVGFGLITLGILNIIVSVSIKKLKTHAEDFIEKIDNRYTDYE